MLKGEFINENSREEPVCSKYSEGLVVVNLGALPPVLRGELVNENSREEPICSKCRDGLVFMNSRSSSTYVEGRARQ